MRLQPARQTQVPILVLPHSLFTSLCLSFPICKMGVKHLPHGKEGVSRGPWNSALTRIPHLFQAAQPRPLIHSTNQHTPLPGCIFGPGGHVT